MKDYNQNLSWYSSWYPEPGPASFILLGIVLFLLAYETACPFHKTQEPRDSLSVSPVVVIRRINIVALDIFEENSNFYFSKLVNSLHPRTRYNTIRQELLIHENEIFNQELVNETERNLRALGFFSQVEIQPVAIHPDSIDLTIITRDKWSTRLNTSYRLEGNIHYLGLGLTEDNLLGSGKSYDLSYNHSKERIMRQIQWLDHRLLGTRLDTRIKYQNNSDTRFLGFALARPFFAWNSRWGFNLTFERTDGIAYHYDNSMVLDHDLKDRFLQFTSSIFWGQQVKRHFMAGFIHEKLREGDKKRKFNLLGASLAWMERHYLETKNIDSFDITEDIPIGSLVEVAAAINYQNETQTFHKPYVIYHLYRARKNSGTFFFINSYLQTFFDQHRTIDLLLENELKMYKPISNHLVVARAMWSMLKNPAVYNNITLGDDNGLRGYQLRSRTGTKMLLVNFEDRIRTDIKIYFFRPGFTIFADIGEVWDQSEVINLRNLKSSIGIGLRIGNSKYSTGITRIDFAYNTMERRWRISVSNKSYFSAYSPLGFINDFNLDKLR